MSEIFSWCPDIEEGALNQMKILSELPFVDFCALMPDCLEENSEVLTDKGFKLIRDLDYSDKIANVDIKTKLAFFDFPSKIIYRDLRSNESVYSLEFGRFDFSMISTENHRNWFDDHETKTKDIPDISYIKNYIWNSNGLKDETKCLLTEDEIRFIAWIVGDGNIKITKNKNSNNYRLRFGLKKERKISRLLYLCQKIDIHPTVSVDKKQTTIIINTKESDKYINIVTLDKIFPMWFISLGKKYATALVEEYLQVDGDYTNYVKFNTIKLNSKKKSILDFFSAIISLNIGNSYISSRKHFSSYTNKEEILFYLTVIPSERLYHCKSGLHNTKVIKRKIEYNKKVVCLSCTSGYFIARQNNRTFVTGNCHEGMTMPIGGVIACRNVIIPNAVGVDCGCGMGAVKTNLNLSDFTTEKREEILHSFSRSIPTGFSHNSDKREKEIKIKYEEKIEYILNKHNLSTEYKPFNLIQICEEVYGQVGTLGGGKVIASRP